MRLYFKFFAMHLKSQMQYKASFFMTLIGRFFVSFAELLGLHFMFFNFSAVDGFTYQQVLMCFAVVLMAFSLSETFGRGFDIFPQMLGNGEFDRALVRPQNVVFQVVAAKMEFSRLGSLLQAALVLCYAIPSSGITWTWDKILTLCLMILCGSLIFFGLFLIYAAFSFFTVEGLEFMNVLTDGGRTHGKYPFSIYGKGVLRFLTYIVPLALFQYYPLLYLLDMEKSVFYMFTPVLGLLFLFPCYGFFRFGLRRYKSTGS